MPTKAIVKELNRMTKDPNTRSNYKNYDNTWNICCPSTRHPWMIISFKIWWIKWISTKRPIPQSTKI